MEKQTPLRIIEVKGTPKAWLNDEFNWRREIKDVCSNFKNIKEDIKLKVEIIFYLKNTRIKRPDLDNLAKPVLDTICKINNPQTTDESLSGNLFDYDDDHVFELIVIKKEREEEGATIKIWELENN